MRRLQTILLLTTCVGFWSCTTSPLGRQQLVLFPESTMAEMGVAAFDEMKKETPASRDSRTNGYVTCVANAITAALGASASSRGSWEVLVFDDDQANAFALPGGKIGVYTGLLDVAENQDQLASVIGHEVAHVLARHGNERVSTGTVAQAGMQVIGGSVSQQTMALLGLGAQVGVLLPFSRKQESEADLLGLDLMAKAGFDPRASVQLWRNMGAKQEGGRPPEFMSTHPSHTNRIQHLSERMPHATGIYETARTQGRRPACRR